MQGMQNCIHLQLRSMAFIIRKNRLFKPGSANYLLIRPGEMRPFATGIRHIYLVSFAGKL